MVRERSRAAISKTILLLVLAVLGAAPAYLPAGAGSSTPPARTIDPAAERIIARMAEADSERELALRRYTVTRDYHAVNPQLKKEAVMKAQVRFESPATKQYTILSEEGSSTIRNRVFRHLLEGEVEFLDPQIKRRAALSRENYYFRLVGQERIGDRLCYAIDTEPKRKDKFLLSGRIWVDTCEFALVKLRGSPAKLPSFWTRKVELERDYQRVKDFWMPSRDEAQTQLLAFGQAKIVVHHSNYHLEATGVGTRP